MHLDSLTIYGNVDLRATFAPAPAAPPEDAAPATASKGDNVWAHASTLYVHTKPGVTVRVYTPDGILRDAFITTAAESADDSRNNAAAAETAAAVDAADHSTAAATAAVATSAASATAADVAAGKDSKDNSAADNPRGLTTRRLPTPGIYIVTLDGGPGWKVAVRM
jgi:hypothetical protein